MTFEVPPRVEPFAALLAWVGLVSGVQATVGDQVILSGTCRMNKMAFEVPPRVEPFTALLTGVGLVSGVEATVRDQVLFGGEGAATLVTLPPRSATSIC